MKLLPEWMEKLPLQQQAVLVLALRGPDGFEKHHRSKPLLYSYRASVLAAAHLGRHLRVGEHVNSLMSLRRFEHQDLWDEVLREFSTTVDELPLHYFTHLMHGAQVLAYKHPDKLFRERWMQFYCLCCDYLHTPVENEFVMDTRLSDFGRMLEQVLD